MKCAESRERILEAEPAELRGDVAGELAAHLSACARCRAVADAILAGEAALGRGLGAAVAAPLLDDTALRGLRLEAKRRDRRRILRLRGAVAAATAAAAVVVLLAWPRTEPGRVPTELPVPPELTAAPPVVAAAPGRRVAVFTTPKHPDITVVWTF